MHVRRRKLATLAVALIAALIVTAVLAPAASAHPGGDAHDHHQGGWLSQAPVVLAGAALLGSVLLSLASAAVASARRPSPIKSQEQP